jgi:hypothetical protein
MLMVGDEPPEGNVSKSVCECGKDLVTIGTKYLRIDLLRPKITLSGDEMNGECPHCRRFQRFRINLPKLSALISALGHSG